MATRHLVHRDGDARFAVPAEPWVAGAQGFTRWPMIEDSTDTPAVHTGFGICELEPGGRIPAAVQSFEETYLFLEGEAEATFDGQVYRLGPGDVAFAGVGCVHSFRNAGGGSLRWLETQAPQPPARHSYRFARDWEYLTARLEEET